MKSNSEGNNCNTTIISLKYVHAITHTHASTHTFWNLYYYINTYIHELPIDQ